MASEREKLLHLAETLHRRVVGQDEAVDAVAQAIQRCAQSVPRRPRSGITPDATRRDNMLLKATQAVLDFTPTQSLAV